MAYQKVQGSKKGRKAKEEKAVKNRIMFYINLRDWDLKVNWMNEDESFFVGRLSREGWQSYNVVGYEPAIRIFSEKDDAMLAGYLTNRHNQKSDSWEMALVLEPVEEEN